MTAFKESRVFRLGMAGEVVVRRWLLSRGFAVIPTGLIENGGAPCLESLKKNLILPDLQVFKDGAIAWAEVKTKEKSVLFRIASRMRSGCDWRLWEQYLAVQRETGIEVWIAFLHLFNRELWMQRVHILSHSVIRNEAHSAFQNKAMALWDRERFDVYPVSNSEVGACEPFRAKTGSWVTTPPQEPPPDPQLKLF